MYKSQHFPPEKIVQLSVLSNGGRLLYWQVCFQLMLMFASRRVKVSYWYWHVYDVLKLLILPLTEARSHEALELIHQSLSASISLAHGRLHYTESADITIAYVSTDCNMDRGRCGLVCDLKALKR
jgi:hypothetical protein